MTPTGSPPPPAAIVLAAGASRRLGHPKQLVRLGRENLLERTVRVAAEAGCQPILVVLGAHAEAILEASSLAPATVIINAVWEEGMASSIACGIAALDSHLEPAPSLAASHPSTAPAPGVLILACDQPAVTPEHLRALAAHQDLAASTYAGRPGIPAFFPSSCFEDLLELQGDTGARALLYHARRIPLPGGDFDLDTPADLGILQP